MPIRKDDLRMLGHHSRQIEFHWSKFQDLGLSLEVRKCNYSLTTWCISFPITSTYKEWGVFHPYIHKATPSSSCTIRFHQCYIRWTFHQVAKQYNADTVTKLRIMRHIKYRDRTYKILEPCISILFHLLYIFKSRLHVAWHDVNILSLFGL